MNADDFRKAVTDALAAVERGVRVLEHDLDVPAPLTAAACGTRRMCPVLAPERDAATGGTLQADDHPRRGRLAGAGFADDTEEPAGGQGEADVGDRGRLGTPAAERLGQVLDHEQRFGHRWASSFEAEPTCSCGTDRPRSPGIRTHRVCDGPICSRGGTPARHSSCAKEQRGANAQPSGAS